jgi:uncharacterized protein (TIGR03086 family)
MADMDQLDQLSKAVDQTEGVISRISGDQAELPTPCESWDVDDLIGHVVDDLHRFTARAAGSENGGPADQSTSDDWVGTYREAADGLLSAWQRDGALDRTVKLPFGDVPATWFVGQQLADLLVHGWDLAKATGQATDLDPELGEAALDWGRENLRPEFRGKEFGPEVPVPDEAPLYDRLAAFFGRDPG